MKILLDNNAIDQVAKNIDFIKEHKEISFYICREVAEEVSAKSGTYFATGNVISLLKAGVSYLPNAVFILGHSLLDGESEFCDERTGSVYDNILYENKSNVSDAIIASTAVSNNCILLTYDSRLYKRMKKFGYEVITFEELRELVK